METWFLSRLLTLVFLAQGQACFLQTNKDQVIPGTTQDVELVCRQDFDHGATAKIDAISSIQIVKQGLFGNKITFAQLRAGSVKQSTKEGDILVTGEINRDGASFLKVKWEVASPNTPGAYGCEVVAHDTDDNVVSPHANPILIKEKFLAPDDVNKLILSATAGCEKKQKALELEISQLKAFIDNELNAKGQQISDVKEKLAAEISDINDNMKSECTTKSEVSFQISELRKSTLNRIKGESSHSSCEKSFGDLKSSVFHLRTDMSKKFNSVEQDTKSIDIYVSNITDFFTEQIKDMQTKLDLCCPSHVPTTATPTTPGRPTKGVPMSSSPRWSTPATTSNDSQVSRRDQWPSGKYTMVKPRVGCPSSDDRELVFYTIPYKLGSVVDGINGLFKVYLKAAGFDVAPLQFCCRSTDSSTRKTWPKGSYCIGKSYTSCPEGFSEGERTHAIMSDTGKGEHGENQKVGTYKQLYCCRSDGEANAPLTLPTRDPFYMYRHNGECQKVQGMDVQEDSVVIWKSIGVSDTLTSKSTTPDVDSDGNIILCHYLRPS